MLVINPSIQVPDSEFEWKFARSGGPGGQNVNKVASKALLIWNVAQTTSIPENVKIRLALQQKRFFTNESTMIVVSQRHRDQERNREDCLEKLRAIILQALAVPKARKKTRPSRGSKRRRVEAKRHRGAIKQHRRRPSDD